MFNVYTQPYGYGRPSNILYSTSRSPLCAVLTYRHYRAIYNSGCAFPFCAVLAYGHHGFTKNLGSRFRLCDCTYFSTWTHSLT